MVLQIQLLDKSLLKPEITIELTSFKKTSFQYLINIVHKLIMPIPIEITKMFIKYAKSL
ncbi:Hypothetical protein Nlim_1746 [Candidatus Nitrosarchaeum limnium SFB1]|uniref:Uncharacterized protein n=1 Tax=Candidatus Nitrosarchaeum limnium SFB1 TaxID=886738 RepID=F3KMJ6_9ARCH|nr:Hypothetical protein Nlim_1746 [Candidatus Nitrosarchaeum limnium SFB1]